MHILLLVDNCDKSIKTLKVLPYLLSVIQTAGHVWIPLLLTYFYIILWYLPHLLPYYSMAKWPLMSQSDCGSGIRTNHSIVNDSRWTNNGCILIGSKERISWLETDSIRLLRSQFFAPCVANATMSLRLAV